MALTDARRKAIAFFLVCLGVVDVEASQYRNVRGDSNDRVEVLRTSNLRSAYLARAGNVRYDADEMSLPGVQHQLRRHFDVVVALLVANTSASIELALDRLEASLGQGWTTTERDSWRRRLLGNRRLQIARLVAYRNRGLFPLNEGHAPRAVPIFVDEHDTACAVGHLMRLSGLVREVAEIRDGNNLVYVPDAADGPLVTWTLTSGITFEEAALIQPAYGPVLLPKPDDAVEVLGNDASFVFENLRYSNFKLFAGEDNPERPTVNIPVGHTFCSWFNCVIDFATVDHLSIKRVDTFDLAIPKTDFERVVIPDSHSVVQTSSPYPRAIVQFDVEVTAPNLRIAALPNGGSLSSSSYFDGPQFRLFVNSSRDRLWIDQAYNPMPKCEFCWFSELAVLTTPFGRLEERTRQALISGRPIA